MSPALSMAAFALAISLTPGPVNPVALTSGARHGWRAATPHVFGATLGFTALLVLVGLGLRGPRAGCRRWWPDCAGAAWRSCCGRRGGWRSMTDA